MTQVFLTITEPFVDTYGILRHSNVSWPVYKSVEGQESFLVKDVDGQWFIVPNDKCMLTNEHGKLANMSDVEYSLSRRTPAITDHNKHLKDFIGIDVRRNQVMESQGGRFSDKEKKELINQKNEKGNHTPQVAKPHERNLHIQP
jgi:hypothetical protein